MSKELEHNKYVKKGIEHINNHKVLKISESFNEIERIKSEKLSIDTSVIEHKSTSEAVNRRFKRNL